jgi:hypothetical protein
MNDISEAERLALITHDTQAQNGPADAVAACPLLG